MSVVRILLEEKQGEKKRGIVIYDLLYEIVIYNRLADQSRVIVSILLSLSLSLSFFLPFFVSRFGTLFRDCEFSKTREENCGKRSFVRSSTVEIGRMGRIVAEESLIKEFDFLRDKRSL